METTRNLLIELSTYLVRLDFVTIPDLSVTQHQACALWSMDAEEGDAVLSRLCEEGFLVATEDGLFERPQTLQQL